MTEAIRVVDRRDIQAEMRPLISSRKHILTEAFLERAFRSKEIADHHRWVRYPLKGISIFISAGAKVPYIPISLLLPGGPFFAAANVLAFFNLECWAINASLDDVLEPKGRWEVLLASRNSRGGCYKVSVLTSALVLALLSQVPVALPALQYDPEFRVPAAGVLLGAGALLPIRSLQLSIDRSIQAVRCSQGARSQQIELIRREFLGVFGEYQHEFRLAGFDKQTSIIRQFAECAGSRDVEAIQATVSLIFEEVSKSRLTRPQKTVCDGRLSQVVGYTLTASFMAALALYTEAKTKEYLIDNEPIAVGFATATIGAWVYLTGASVVATTQRISQGIFNAVTGNKSKTLSEQVYPKLNLALKLLGIGLNLGALGPTFVIWGDFFNSNIYTEVYFEAAIGLSLFLLLTTATFDIVDGAIEELILHRGTVDQKQVIELNRQLSKFQHLLKESSLLDLSVFVLNSPESVKRQLLDRAQLVVSSLEEYVEANHY